MLGNVSPMYRCTLDSIQLLAVTKSSVLQEYGPQHILEPIMRDVRVLEEVCMARVIGFLSTCNILINRKGFLCVLTGLSTF